MLFSARTAVSGDTVSGSGLPAVDPAVLLTPSAAAIVPDATTWSPLGGWSGTCFDVGCGHTGWIAMRYEFAAAGNYVLEVGVVNWSDELYDSGLAYAGTLVPVPEPETYAMLLAGLGLLAWVTHRRKTRAWHPAAAIPHTRARPSGRAFSCACLGSPSTAIICLPDGLAWPRWRVGKLYTSDRPGWHLHTLCSACRRNPL